MNRFMNWVLAATMICGASVFTSCTKEDNPTDPAANLSEKIIGKWIQSERDGKPMPTNRKTVTTFLSPTYATSSASLTIRNNETVWSSKNEFDVKIEGNKVTLTRQKDETTETILEYIVKYINDYEMISDYRHVNDRNSEQSNRPPQNILLEKITTDYSKDVLGLWEGRVSSEEGSEYDDGELHRWEFKDDGTFVFYFQGENDEWYASNDEFAEYFCDGTLLCTRWKNVGEGTKENREWWEIQSIKNGVMKWYGLRQREDGTTYVASFYMTKVQ